MKENKVANMKDIMDTPFSREEATTLITAQTKARMDEVGKLMDGFIKKFDAFSTAMLEAQGQRDAEILNQLKGLNTNLTSIISDHNKSINVLETNTKNHSDIIKEITGLSTSITDMVASNNKSIGELGHIAANISKASCAPVTEKMLKMRKKASTLLTQFKDKKKLSTEDACRIVYQAMIDDYAVNVHAMFKQFHGYNSRLQMCLERPDILPYFNATLSDLVGTKKSRKKNNSAPSRLATQFPGYMKDDCKRLFPNYSEYKAAYIIYRKMEEISDINLMTYIKNHSGQIPYKHFSRGYFINNDKILKQVYLEAINQLKKGA